ncbi:protein phosphatase 2C family protein isoform X2 [Wolffia australiana]
MSKDDDSNNSGLPKRESLFDVKDSCGKRQKVVFTEKVQSSKTQAPLDVDCSILKNGDTRFLSEVNTNQESMESDTRKGITTPNPIQCVNKTIQIESCVAEDVGSRHSMEDAWVMLPDAIMESPGTLRCAHFAIYDGHGGRLAAEYAQKHLHPNVLAAGLPRESMDVKAAKKAILEGGWHDGATAVCVWVLGQMVFVANIGDAKAVLARLSLPKGPNEEKDETNFTVKSIVITREHKAIFPSERVRIQKAGGTIGVNGRLQGRLEVSRAFGDRQFKKVGVIATPDIHSFELTGRERFLILACDGLWEVFAPGDAVDFVQKHLQDGLSVATVAKRLVREAVRERRCKDNCTAIVVIFKN